MLSDSYLMRRFIIQAVASVENFDSKDFSENWLPMAGLDRLSCL